jgi:TolB protein
VTQGVELDPNGYDVQIPGGTGHTLPVNGSLTVGRLAPGTYDIRVDGLASNCTPEGGSERTVEVTDRQLTAVAFAVTCITATGVLEVTTRTTGTDLDPIGYRVTVGTTWQGNTTATATSIRFNGLPPGTYPVTLEQVASNCTVAGSNPQNATISVTGQFTRDTTRVAFEVSCVRTPMIAYTRELSVLLARADGSEAFVVAAAGMDPSWSPDGKHLVYSRVECYYEDYDCWSTGLSRVSVDDLVVTDLTTGSDYSPAWSPDGTSIVFGREGQLRILSLQSSVVTLLNPPVGSAEQPTWSPDGQRIAFTCLVAGQKDICAMSVDGTGFIRLTTSPDNDYRPAWSPGADRIAFSSSGELGTSVMTIPAAGGTATSVTAGRMAAWVGSDARLLYLGAGGFLNLIDLDGSNHVTLPELSEGAPAWRP